MTIKFAVIGTGKITEQFIDAAKQDDRFELAAVYSRSQETAQAFADKHQASYAFNDLQALAQSEYIDAVYIASPNSCHAEQSILMMAAGKHVLCEKPVAADTKQLDLMIATAERCKVTFMEAMLTSFLPNLAQIKSAMSQIAPLRMFSAGFCQYSSRYSKYLAGEMPNTFNPDFANGALMDIGIYPLYVALQLLGEPDDSTGFLTLLDSGVDGCGDVLLNYQQTHKMQAHISFSKVSSGENICQLQGEKGRIVWQHSSTINSVDLYLDGQDKQTLTVMQNDNRMVYELNHFIDLIEQGDIQSTVNTWQLSKQALSIIEQVRKNNGVIYPSDHNH